MIKEFKEFVSKGNVMDLAVGVIIGAAFGKIVESMVKDIITPIIGLIGGQPDFSGIAFGAHTVIKGGKEVLEGGIMVGNFLNAAVSFLILAAVIFFVFVKPMNRLKALNATPSTATVPEPTAEEKLLAEIRDLLRDKG